MELLPVRLPETVSKTIVGLNLTLGQSDSTVDYEPVQWKKEKVLIAVLQEMTQDSISLRSKSCPLPLLSLSLICLQVHLFMPVDNSVT
jgi:hypothetical protein